MFFICIHNGLQAILEKCRQQLGKCVIHRGHRICRSALWSHHLWSSSEITFDLLRVFVFWDSWLLFGRCQLFDLSAGAALLLQSESNLRNEATEHHVWKCEDPLRKQWDGSRANTSPNSLFTRWFGFWHELCYVKCYSFNKDGKMFEIHPSLEWYSRWCVQCECRRLQRLLLSHVFVFVKAVRGKHVQNSLIASPIICLSPLGCLYQGYQVYHGLHYWAHFLCV